MTIAIIIIFVIGYLLITLEQTIKLNKTATALIMGVLCWLMYIVGVENKEQVIVELEHHLAEISQILFFLMGAMTIVELIDAHDGFDIVKKFIRTADNRRLLWIMGGLSFVLSAIIDNLTTAIVMVSILRKIIDDKEQRLPFIGIMIICVNAGGAWSPIGDVTTTMLWIKGQISALGVMKELILPSIVCALVPLSFWNFKLPKKNISSDMHTSAINPDSTKMLVIGISILLMVPVFKVLTHLPPYMGILLGLGLVWVFSELIHRHKDDQLRKPLTVAHALSKIDTESILFFLGILLSIGALDATHLLRDFAGILNDKVGNLNAIALLIGLFSSVVDNVPLLAAVQNMYSLTEFPMDSGLWLFMAYTTGTGGSILIIGSAAGVAVMGMEDINFLWYLRKISWLALLGFLAGAGVFLILH